MARARRNIRAAGRQVRRLGEAQRRERLLNRLDRVTEPILLLLAFAMIPLLIGPFLWELTSTEIVLFASLNLCIWIAFAADFTAKLIIAPRWRIYLRLNWLQAVVVLVPFFRPLILVRLLLFGSRAVVGLRRLAELDFVVVLTGGLVIIGATVMFSVDSGADSEIRSFGDALWWGFVTVTTVGYGDIVPTSATGRIVALVVMTGGIALFGAIAGNVVALLTAVGRTRTAQPPETASDRVLTELQAMRTQMLLMQDAIETLASRTSQGD